LLWNNCVGHCPLSEEVFVTLSSISEWTDMKYYPATTLTDYKNLVIWSFWDAKVVFCTLLLLLMVHHDSENYRFHPFHCETLVQSIYVIFSVSETESYLQIAIKVTYISFSWHQQRSYLSALVLISKLNFSLNTINEWLLLLKEHRLQTYGSGIMWEHMIQKKYLGSFCFSCHLWLRALHHPHYTHYKCNYTTLAVDTSSYMQYKVAKVKLSLCLTKYHPMKMWAGRSEF